MNSNWFVAEGFLKGTRWKNFISSAQIEVVHCLRPQVPLQFGISVQPVKFTGVRRSKHWSPSRAGVYIDIPFLNGYAHDLYKNNSLSNYSGVK